MLATDCLVQNRFVAIAQFDNLENKKDFPTGESFFDVFLVSIVDILLGWLKYLTKDTCCANLILCGGNLF